MLLWQGHRHEPKVQHIIIYKHHLMIYESTTFNILGMKENATPHHLWFIKALDMRAMKAIYTCKSLSCPPSWIIHDHDHKFKQETSSLPLEYYALISGYFQKSQLQPNFTNSNIGSIKLIIWATLHQIKTTFNHVDLDIYC